MFRLVRLESNCSMISLTYVRLADDVLDEYNYFCFKRLIESERQILKNSRISLMLNLEVPLVRFTNVIGISIAIELGEYAKTSRRNLNPLALIK